MEIYSWLLQISASATQLTTTTRSVNDYLFVGYVITAFLNKDGRYLAAFFFSSMLFTLNWFDFLQEYQLYIITFIVYSYILTKEQMLKTSVACVIMLYIILVFAFDALFYGVGGLNGQSKTIVWENIEYIATFAHTILILSLIEFRRIYKHIGSVVSFIISYAVTMRYFVRV